MVQRQYIGVIQKMSGGFLLAFLVTLLTGCAQDKEGVVAPSTCSTSPSSVVSYTRDIYPIIKNNCLSCHDAKNHFGGIVIENYTQISESSKSGELYQSVYFPPSGNPPYMPKGAPLLKCEIGLIEAWAKQGSLNN
jgi:hypothetical protein